MRTGVIHWAFPPVIGGVEMHLLTILPEMVKQGSKVFLLCGSAEGAKASETVQGVSVTRVKEMVSSNIDKIATEGGDIYSTARAVFGKFLEENKIEIVHAHNLQMDFFDYSRALVDECAKRKIPTCLLIHNDVFIDREEEVMWKILALPWTKLIPISKYIESTLKRKLVDIPKDRWQVIIHGISIDGFKPLGVNERKELKTKYGFKDRRVILHPARFLPWKGILPAIKAMPAVRDRFQDAVMVMTGKAKLVFKEMDELTKYYSEIDDFIEKNDLSKNIHIGKYTHVDIPKLAALSDVSIYTTIGEEPFGLCPVEAMACKVPVVVTRSGGLVESVVDGETGFIIDKDEDGLPGQLAAKIIELFSNPELAKKFGENGRKRAETIFTKQRMAKDLIELSEKLLDGSGEPE